MLSLFGHQIFCGSKWILFGRKRAKMVLLTLKVTVWPNHNGAISSRWTPSWWTLSRTPGSRTIGEKPRPLPRQDVCSHIEMPRNVNCSQRGVCPGTTQGSGAPACKWGVKTDLPGGWYKRPPRCCRCTPTYDDLSGPRESVSEPETRPASPSSWCATRDGDRSTDRGQGGHPWPLLNRWGMRPSLALPGNKELPALVPMTRTKVSYTCLSHLGIATWPCMRSGLPLWENPLVSSHHSRGLMYSRPKYITLDAAAIRPSSLWNWLTVSYRPSLTLLTAVRIDSIRVFTSCSIYQSLPGTHQCWNNPIERQWQSAKCDCLVLQCAGPIETHLAVVSTSGVYSTWKLYSSKSTDILPENNLDRSWSHRLEYYLSKSLKICDNYCT